MIEYFPMQGGEDLLTPALSVEPGRLRFSRNYECDENGRYRRIDGYERFDGHPKPSEASYWVLNFDAGSAAIAVEDTVTGATSSASGEALVVTVESGSWAGSDAAGYLILFNVTGTFQDNENLQVSAATKAVANGTASEKGADNDTDHDTWLQASIEATRADISTVSGQGNILGVWQYNGVVYAFRNATGGATAKMYKSSTSGWTECDLGEKLSFDTGSAAFVAGETVTQGGVTAVVRKVIVTSGTWAGSDAAGYFTITGRSGGNFSAAGITGSVAGVANATGVQISNTLSPSGRYEFINYNFGGHSGTKMMYGCDGVNKAFEWDGTYFVFLTTGMTTDTPKHIIAHENHLFLSFSGGSVQNSSIHDPYTWSVVTGADEIGMGDEIVGFLSMPKALMVFTRNKTGVIYGTSTADFALTTLADESGAIEWTIQKIGLGLYLDDRGITTVAAVQDYGDFAYNSISSVVKPIIDELSGYEIASLRVRKKNQYRIFYTDGHCLCLTLEKNKIIGFTRFYYDEEVRCCCSVENSSGDEELYFGSSDGYVYQMDKGTSFDGGAIVSFIKTHFWNFKTPAHKKRYRKASIELDAPTTATITIYPEFNYGGEQDSEIDMSIDRSGGYWDIDEWESFIWDGPHVSTGEARVDGSGLNLALNFYHSAIYDSPFTIQGVIVQFGMRGLQR